MEAKWPTVFGMPTAFELADHPADELLRRIRKGLPAATLDQVAASLGIPKGVLAAKLRIAKRTLTRKQSERRALSVEESEKVLRVARIRNVARALFRTDEAVADWLGKADPALDGAAPLDLLDTEIGARQVEELILSLGHGQFV
jgi:putative toxin-antitoxin system antitoxin component (TIGR02293 family)